MELYSPNWCIGAGLENAAINRNIETTAIVLLVHLDKSGRGAHPYLREGSSDSGSENADAEQDNGILSTGSDESAHALIFSQILDEVISVVYQAFSTSSYVPVMASELATRGIPVTRNGCHASSGCSAQETPAGKDKRRNQDEV